MSLTHPDSAFISEFSTKRKCSTTLINVRASMYYEFEFVAINQFCAIRAR